MGSIAGLRSEAMALRSKENTNFEVSAYLGTVNKSLGNQITGMIDQLQSTILERTKAYNQGIANVKKSLEGKSGICDQMVVTAWQGVNDMIALTSANFGSGWGILQSALSVAGKLIAGGSSKRAMEMKILADTYNYEKAISQLGFTKVYTDYMNSSGGVPMSDAGAVSLLNKRDSLSPRYKPRDVNRGTGLSWGQSNRNNGELGNYSILSLPTGTGINPSPVGYVGTLRKV